MYKEAYVKLFIYNHIGILLLICFSISLVNKGIKKNTKRSNLDIIIRKISAWPE